MWLLAPNTKHSEGLSSTINWISDTAIWPASRQNESDILHKTSWTAAISQIAVGKSHKKLEPSLFRRAVPSPITIQYPSNAISATMVNACCAMVCTLKGIPNRKCIAMEIAGELVEQDDEGEDRESRPAEEG